MGSAPPPITIDKVVVKDHQDFGRSAFAAQAIATGELVICEEPLLLFDRFKDDKVLQGLLKQVQQYVTSHAAELTDADMVHPQDWHSACGFYMEFLKAPESVQQTVLTGMFNNPEGPGIEKTAPVKRTAVQAQVLAALSPEITKILKIVAIVAAGGASGAAEVKPAETDPAVVHKVLLASELNMHGLGNSGAIYAVGSKLAHTCDSPNTFYKSFRGRGCHIAQRDIQEGELLTTSYLPRHMQLMARHARQWYLRDYFSMHCCCPRCSSSIDRLCALPCPRCASPDCARSKDGYLPASFIDSAGSKPPTCGLLVFDPHKAAAAASSSSSAAADGDAAAAAADSSSSSAAKPWQCTKCGVELADIDSELVGDYPFIQSAQLRLEDWALRAATRFDPQEPKDESLLQDLLVVMGPYHWSVHYALASQTDHLMSVVKTIGTHIAKKDPITPQHMAVLSRYVMGLGLNISRSWSWLTEAAELTPEAAAGVLSDLLVYSAISLMETSCHMMMSPKLCTSQEELITHMRVLAHSLLARVQPVLVKYDTNWPLEEPHPLIRAVELVVQFDKQATAKAAAVKEAAAAGGGGQALSMNQLMDFLPPAAGKGTAAGKSGAAGASSSSSSSSKAKGKKKAGGKK